MFKKLILSLIFILLPSTIFASPINITYFDDIQYNDKQNINTIVSVTSKLFEDRLGLKLTKQVNIFVVDSQNSYRDLLHRLSIHNYEDLASRSSGVTFKNIIIVDISGCSETRIRHVIAHEITHQYQLQIKGASALDDMVKLEGMAEYIGYMFGEGMPKNIPNKHISYEEIKGYNDWKRANQHSPHDVYAQCLYEYTKIVANNNGNIVF